LRKVAPEFAISSYGFDNRYHFPHQQALQTYKDLAIPIFNTVDCGKINIHLSKQGVKAPSCFYS
jgi:competence protein ComEC